MMTKRGTYKGAYSSVCRDDETHEEITKNTGPNCHSPAQSNRNHRRGYAARNIRDSRSSCYLLQIQIWGEQGLPTSQLDTAHASAIQYAT